MQPIGDWGLLVRKYIELVFIFILCMDHRSRVILPVGYWFSQGKVQTLPSMLVQDTSNQVVMCKSATTTSVLNVPRYIG